MRVTITPATVPSSSAGGEGTDDDDDDDDNDDDNDDDDSSGGGGEESRAVSSGGGGRRSCLRIEVSDNGCGMSDIDYCVSAFGSSKNGKTTTTTTTKGGGGGERRRRKTDNDQLTTIVKKKNAKMGGNNKRQKSSSSRMMNHLAAAAAAPDDDDDDGDIGDDCTSGRYGIGLTLCLLHAQRLVPGTGACVTSATSSDIEWTRGTYEPDADADVVVCKRRERFSKNDVGESGTTVSLLVPVSGGWGVALFCHSRARSIGAFPFSLRACFTREVFRRVCP